MPHRFFTSETHAPTTAVKISRLIFLPGETGHQVGDGLNIMEAKSTLRNVSQRNKQPPMTSVPPAQITRQVRHRGNWPEKLSLGGRWTKPGEERQQPTGIPKEILKNSCTLEDTLAVSAVYCASRTELNTGVNDHVQEISKESSLERVELVVKGVVKLLRSTRIWSTTDHKSTQLSQDVRVSTETRSKIRRKTICHKHLWL